MLFFPYRTVYIVTWIGAIQHNQALFLVLGTSLHYVVKGTDVSIEAGSYILYVEYHYIRACQRVKLAVSCFSHKVKGWALPCGYLSRFECILRHLHPLEIHAQEQIHARFLFDWSGCLAGVFSHKEKYGLLLEKPVFL